MGILIFTTPGDSVVTCLVSAVLHLGFGSELFRGHVNLGMDSLYRVVQRVIGSRDGSFYVVHSNTATNQAEKARPVARPVRLGASYIFGCSGIEPSNGGPDDNPLLTRSMVTIAAALYSIVIAVVVATAAAGIELVFSALQWPRRGVWLLALAISVLVPVLLVHEAWRFSGLQQMPFGMPMTTLTPAAFLLRNHSPELTALNTILAGGWGVATAFYLVLGFSAWVRLQILSRRWIHVLIDDQQVFLSEKLGPAVYGLFSPRIVVPRMAAGT